MNLPKDFTDIPNRSWALDSSDSQALLDSLPLDIRNAFIQYFFTKQTTPELIQYFKDNSSIFDSVQNDPGNALSFEYLYTRQVSTNIDKYFTECKAGHQIYQRLLALEENLPYWLTHLLHGRQVISVDNIGSGAGRDMINVLGKNQHFIDRVRIRNIDPNAESLAISKQLAKEMCVSDYFYFHNNKLSDVPAINADLVLLIGILCPLHRRVCKIVLKNIAPYVRTGGMVIYSTALHKMVLEDPLTDSIMRLAGWHMNYKSEEESEDLAKSFGWRVICKFFDEPLHYHCMVLVEVQ